jgi:CBS domain containing-hemolysin-like protein
VRVRGTVRLDEAGKVLGRAIEHPRVTTVSGLVLLLLGRPAAVGDVVTWQHVQVEVTAVAGRGVGEALVTPLPTPRKLPDDRTPR